MAHPERYFPNPLPDGTEQPFDAATVKRLLRNTFLNVQDVLMRPEGAGVSGDGVYVGETGQLASPPRPFFPVSGGKA